jgi:hypothetical protein
MYSDLERRCDGGDPPGDVVGEKLRGLPAELQPPCGWEELGPRILRERSGLERASLGERWLGPAVRWSAFAAAGCAIVLGAAAIVASHHHLQGRPSEAPVSASSGAPRALAPASAEPETHNALARAAAAERWLASKPESSAVVYVGSRLAVVDLENGIASLDDELNAARVLDGSSVRVRQLQLERAQLVDSLAQIRYAEILADETQ